MDYVFGQIVLSKAGHDKGQFYVIMNSYPEYVYVVDGKLKLLSSPKKKNKKHIQHTNYISEELIKKREENTLTDVDVKRALKEYRQSK